MSVPTRHRSVRLVRPTLAALYALAAFLLPLTTFYPREARAGGPDAGVELLGRTYVSGLAIVPNAGYSLDAYGEPGTIFGGYVRPNLAASISPATLGARTELEFYPAAFIGFTAGRSWSRRFSDFPGLDCASADCLGGLNESDLGVRLAGRARIGSTDWIATARLTRAFFDDSESAAFTEPRDRIEPANAVRVPGRGGRVDSVAAVVGCAFAPDWIGGVIYQNAQVHDRDRAGQNSELLFLRRKIDAWTFTVAAGRFVSELASAGPSAAVTVAYTVLPIAELGR